MSQAYACLVIGQTSIPYTVRYSSRTKQQRLVVTAEAVEVVAPTEQKRVLETCDKNRTIRIYWQLIYAPLVVLEYVVAHEVVHLLHRHHEDAFWETLGSVMPDCITSYRARDTSSQPEVDYGWNLR